MFAGHHEPIDIVSFLFNAYFAIYTNASEKVSSYCVYQNTISWN